MDKIVKLLDFKNELKKSLTKEIGRVLEKDEIYVKNIERISSLQEQIKTVDALYDLIENTTNVK